MSVLKVGDGCPAFKETSLSSYDEAFLFDFCTKLFVKYLEKMEDTVR